MIGIPYLIVEVFSGAPWEYGLLEGVCGAAGIFAVFVIPFTKGLGLAKALLFSMIGILFGSAVFLTIISPTFFSVFDASVAVRIIILGIGCFVTFLFFGVYGVYFISFQHQNVPSAGLGKSMSLVMMFNALGRVIGFFLFGFLFDTSLALAILVMVVGVASKIVIHIPFLLADKRPLMGQATEKDQAT